MARAAFYAVVRCLHAGVGCSGTQIVVAPLQVAFTELPVASRFGGLLILIAGVVLARVLGRVCQGILSGRLGDFSIGRCPLGQAAGASSVPVNAEGGLIMQVWVKTSLRMRLWRLKGHNGKPPLRSLDGW